MNRRAEKGHIAEEGGESAMDTTNANNGPTAANEGMTTKPVDPR